jgi:hypothetical protein
MHFALSLEFLTPHMKLDVALERPYPSLEPMTSLS